MQSGFMTKSERGFSTPLCSWNVGEAVVLVGRAVFIKTVPALTKA